MPNWEFEGDGYLRRQVEPTIVASTRNRNHLLAFFNDCRAEDVDDDPWGGRKGYPEPPNQQPQSADPIDIFHRGQIRARVLAVDIH